MTTMITSAIGWITTAALAAVAGWLGARRRTRRSDDEAMRQGMRALMRKELVDAYDAYHNQGRHLTVERKTQLDEMYEAYHALGGNGTISQMYEEIGRDVWIERG